MKVQIKTAIMSHLSDAQQYMSITMLNEACKEINFVKMLILTYTDTYIEVDEKELDEIWNKLK